MFLADGKWFITDTDVQGYRCTCPPFLQLKAKLTYRLYFQMSLLNSTQLAIITNTELLAFHQDATVGTPAMPFTAFSSMPTTSPPEYYSGTSSKGVHVFIINTSSATATKQFSFANIPGLASSGSFKVHDMWAEADLSSSYTASSTFSVSVAPHDTVAYLITSA